MKTVEEFYRELSESITLQDELKNTADGALEAFLKKHGCDADTKEFAAFIRARSEGAIEDDDAAAIAGGAPFPSDLLWSGQHPVV